MKQNLTTNQIEFACECVSKWFQICENNQKEVDPSFIQNSSLLRRLLSGKEAHTNPPPLRFGYPAWEIVESPEIQVQFVKEDGDNLTIDGHDGYIWVNKSENILKYTRLNLHFKLIEKEIIPDPVCIKEGSDPQYYKYIVKFLQKIDT